MLLPSKSERIAWKIALAGILSGMLVITPALARQDDQTIKLRADLVTVDVAVTDKDGNFIRDLKSEDFAIHEDGIPQKLEFFEANQETSLSRPLAAVFAIDNSGSIKPEEVVKQRQAAENFMTLLRPESVFAVVAFNYDPRIVQDFTSDPKKISHAFQRIGSPGGNSGIFAAISRCVSMLQKAPRFRSGRRLRRVALIISDGYDNVGRPDEQAHIIENANAAEVTVYSITLPSFAPGLGAQRIMTLLDVSRIIPMTGGADFSANARDFTPIFKAIAEEIRSSYTLAYYPPEKSKNNAGVHQIRVEIKRPGAIVRASRTSYKAPR